MTIQCSDAASFFAVTGHRLTFPKSSRGTVRCWGVTMTCLRGGSTLRTRSRGGRGAAQRGRYAVATSYAGDVPKTWKAAAPVEKPHKRHREGRVRMGPEPPSQSLKSAAAVVRVLKVRVVGRQELQRPAGLKFQHVSCHGLLLRLAKLVSRLTQKLVQSWFKAGFPAGSKTASKPVKTWFTQFTLTSLSFPSAQLLKPSTPKIGPCDTALLRLRLLSWRFFAISRVAAWILSCLKAGHSP